MHTLESDALIARLEKLEGEHVRLNRTVRRWRTIGTACLVGGLLLLVGGAQKPSTRTPPPEEIRRDTTIFAQRIILVGPGSTAFKSKIHAAMQVDDKNNTSFYMNDANGKPALALLVAADGQRMLQFFEKDSVQLRLMVDENQLPSLTLFGPHATQLQLSVDAESTAGLHAFDKEGKRRLRLAITADDSAALACYDSQQRFKLGFGTNSDGAASLRVTDEKKRDRIGVGISANGVPAIYIKDPEAKTVFQAPQP
jgi:hypothetical protein